jgi:hypothetical protein
MNSRPIIFAVILVATLAVITSADIATASVGEARVGLGFSSSHCRNSLTGIPLVTQCRADIGDYTSPYAVANPAHLPPRSCTSTTCPVYLESSILDTYPPLHD